MTIGCEAPFVRKLAAIAYAAKGGITQNDKYSMQKLLDTGYISPRAYSNPPLYILEEQFMSSMESCGPLKKEDVTTLPWTHSTFSKGLHLQTMVAFTDQHDAEVAEELFAPKLSRSFVNNVRESASRMKRQITLPEQFEIALELTNNNPLAAAIIAHAGSRSITKLRDSRVAPELTFTLDDAREWRDCVSTFQDITGEYGSPRADSYHFWGAFIAGLVSEIAITSKDKILNPLYRFIYLNTAEITTLLRYKLAGKGMGPVHKEPDILGYHIGSMMGQHIK